MGEEMLKKLSLPIFLPLVVWLWMSLVFDYVWHHDLPPQGTGPSYSNAMYPVGAVLALPLAAVLHLLVGWPSCWLLRRTDQLWKFLVTGVVVAFGMSLLLSLMFKRRALGESAFTPLPYVCLVFVPPILFGYFMTFRMRTPSARKEDQPIQRATDNDGAAPRHV